MRILFTGGGTGGHFYPIVAVAEKIREICKKEKIIQPELIYIGPNVLDPDALVNNDIVYIKSPAGKMRRYFSLQNFTDLFKTLAGIIRSTYILYKIYPDVVFSKGGYAAFPTTVAAKILSIPLVIHESDAKPGRANLIASKWADFIATSYPGTAKFFIQKGVPKEKIALIGHPVEEAKQTPIKDGAYDYFGFKKDIPTILIMGGSLGAKAINDAVLDVLPELLKEYQVIHQTGKNNFDEVKSLSKVVLENIPGGVDKSRYKIFPFLNRLQIRMAAGAADLVISRAGTGTITEISHWGLPSILVPIPEEVSHDQTYNAYFYASFGGAVVIEQKNLKKSILLSEIKRILTDKDLYNKMSYAAKKFARKDAAEKLARKLLEIALKHEL